MFELLLWLLPALAGLAVLAFIYAIIASMIGDWRPRAVWRALKG